MKYIGAIDQGTTSTRFIVFDDAGHPVGSDQLEHRQVFPQPGWVEHDPAEIWQRTCQVIAGGLGAAGLEPSDLAAVGITNQRETTVVWDRSSGLPLANAIVWQDTRTTQLCRDFGETDGQDRFRAVTGLPLATYFSGPKMRWLLDTDRHIARAIETGDALFGTIDSWIAWNLTGRHVTDVTNASRTMLMSLDSLDWHDDLLAAFGIPRDALPEIASSSQILGDCEDPLPGVPLAGILGDQHAALFGQACFLQGDVKNTYGTGCFLLLNTGTSPVSSNHGLLTTVGYQLEGRKAVYALEGSVAVAGALVQWLRDNLGIIDKSADVESLAAGVEDNGDVYLVPAFSGLFAPHWRPDARGVLVGLTRFARSGHIARAALEATAFQTGEVVAAMQRDIGEELTTLKADGGMVVNDLLMQFQADILGIPVIRPAVAETTALGAAFVAGLATGVWSSLDDLAHLWSESGRWVPAMNETERDRLTRRWSQAVERTLDWV